MRMGTRTIAVCAIVCFHASPGAAQRTLTLPDVLARAREQAPQIVSARLAMEEARGRLLGASLRFQENPEITGALLETLGQDPNVNVRLAALDALSKRLGEPAVRSGLIRALDKQTSPLMQLALVDVVVESDIRESEGALRQLLRQPGVNETVKKRVEEALHQLTT